VWAATKEDFASFVPGNIVRVIADVQEYRSSLQLKIVSYTVEDVKKYDLEEFVMSSVRTHAELEGELDEVLASFKNEDVSKIINHLFSTLKENFLTFPAATRNHHEYVGGLAEHTLSMVEVGEFMASHYNDVNRDLLIAGILIHDLGKMIELSGPLLTEYTKKGKLLGHISIGSAIILETANELSIESEVPILLAHMILSHHGKLEFGSPVLPMTKEAYLLSTIDNLDSKMNIIDKALSTTEPGEFSDRMWALDNISFYKSEEE
jgi:3'-5' exoribonuclease